jgi:hypothetical protein
MGNNQKVDMNFPGSNNDGTPNAGGTGSDVAFVDEAMALLDLNVEVPDGLIDRVVQNLELVKIDTPSGFDFFKYFQIAAVLVGAMFLGVLLGKHADIGKLHKKHSRQDQALIELREKHHLSEDYTFGKL